MKTAEDRISYNSMHEISGVGKCTIIRNAGILFDMLEDLGMNSK